MKCRIRNLGYFLCSCIVLLLIGCGSDDAAPGATIIAPGDTTITYIGSPGFFDQSAAPLEFQVLSADGKQPVPGASIRFFGGAQVVALTDRQGNPLNPSDPAFFETKTDDRGLPSKDVYAIWSVPPCQGDPAGDPTKAGPDITVTGDVEASVGVSFKTWQVTITVKGCPGGN